MTGSKTFGSVSLTKKRQTILPFLLAVFVTQYSLIKASAQDRQKIPSAQVLDAKAAQESQSSEIQAESAHNQAFELSVSQSNTMPAAQPQFPAAQPRFTNPGQAQSGFPLRPQTAYQPPPSPVRIFSAAALTHSGPGLLSDPGPLAYDLTLCQDDPNFHPPYLLPHPEILNPGSAFGENPQNVRLWQAWADRVAMNAWMVWRQNALPVFGCAEIDIKLNRDGSFQAKRGIYKHHLNRTDIPEEQSSFLMQLDPFLKYLQNTRTFRIPDSICMNDSPTLEFQIQLGVRRKDRSNPYSWCGFMNDWKWWTGTGLQVYDRIESELNGLKRH